MQEFQVNRGNYNAELGGASGGVINIVSKTGTNNAHGSVFGFFRNQKLDAADPFAIVLECRFMGLKALANGVISFRNVRVPRENLNRASGQGLKIALVTLNTGRFKTSGTTKTTPRMNSPSACSKAITGG